MSPLARWSDLQLRFDLPELDEVGEDAAERSISGEEARLISEAARAAWEGRKAPGHPGTRALRRQGTQAAEGEEEGASFDYAQDAEGGAPGWMGEYVMLREQGWPWRVACYMAWASGPKDRRWPRTVAELATEVLGLRGPRCIYTWRRKFPSIDTVVSMLQSAPLWQHRRDVFEALVEMARQPDYKAFNDRKLFLEMTGDFTPRSQVEVGRKAGGDLGELSDDELDMLAGSLLDEQVRRDDDDE